jgi:hypothetical protein
MRRASAPIGSHPNKRNRSTMTSRLNPYQAAPELMKLLFTLDAIGSDTDHPQLNAADASLGRAEVISLDTLQRHPARPRR